MAVQYENPTKHIKTLCGHDENSSESELQAASIINSRPQSVVFRTPNSDFRKQLTNKHFDLSHRQASNSAPASSQQCHCLCSYTTAVFICDGEKFFPQQHIRPRPLVPATEMCSFNPSIVPHTPPTFPQCLQP